MLKQMLLIGAAAMSFPALAQPAEPAGDETPPATQPAPEPTDSAEPAPADTPTDSAQPADGNVPDESAPTDSAPADEDTPEEPASEPDSGA